MFEEQCDAEDAPQNRDRKMDLWTLDRDPVCLGRQEELKKKKKLTFLHQQHTSHFYKATFSIILK